MRAACCKQICWYPIRHKHFDEWPQAGELHRIPCSLQLEVRSSHDGMLCVHVYLRERQGNMDPDHFDLKVVGIRTMTPAPQVTTVRVRRSHLERVYTQPQDYFVPAPVS